MRTFGPFAAIALGLAGQASGQVTTPAVERSPLCPDDMSGWLYSAKYVSRLTPALNPQGPTRNEARTPIDQLLTTACDGALKGVQQLL